MPGLGTQDPTRTLIATEFGKRILNFITPDGGFASWCIAGEDLVRGEVVQVSTNGVAMNVMKNAVNSDMPIGVVYASTNVGELLQIVWGGIAYILPEAAVTAAQGYIIYSSDAEAGRVDQSAAIPSVTLHNRELGHYLETGSGAGVAARAMIHIN